MKNTENAPVFRELLQGQVRFFSGGHLTALEEHIGDDGMLNFGTLWVTAWGKADEDFISAVEYTFIREDMAKKNGEDFSKKIVITGITERGNVQTTGGMGDESQYIKIPVAFDRVFLVEGTFHNPIVRDITAQILRS